MISLADLAALHGTYAPRETPTVTPTRLGDLHVGPGSPVIMGTVNLSRDSTYRESVAVSTEAAIRKVRVQASQGAGVVDIGAESSTARAARVDAGAQIGALVPVIEAVADDVHVSVETYRPTVVEACLKAGARVVNLTGRDDEETMLALAAEYDAAVVLCYGEAANVREPTELDLATDPITILLEHFAPRLEAAREIGVSDLVIDPGMGFFYDNLVDPMTRVRHQTRVLSHGFRLHELGVPVCNALPHAFDLFEDEFRTAESFFAVLASLGGTHLFRTHEVARVRAVLAAMTELAVTPS